MSNPLKTVLVNLPQTFTDAEKAQAKANLGIESGGGSGEVTAQNVGRAVLSKNTNDYYYVSVLIPRAAGKTIGDLYDTTGLSTWYTAGACCISISETDDYFVFSGNLSTSNTVLEMYNALKLLDSADRKIIIDGSYAWGVGLASFPYLGGLTFDLVLNCLNPICQLGTNANNISNYARSVRATSTIRILGSTNNSGNSQGFYTTGAFQYWPEDTVLTFDFCHTKSPGQYGYPPIGFGGSKFKQAPTLLNTDGIGSTANMFNNCSALEDIPLFDVSSVKNCSYMFAYCAKVKTGMYAMYQALAAANPSNFSSCFTGCGTDTPEGQAERALIPTSWGGDA